MGTLDYNCIWQCSAPNARTVFVRTLYVRTESVYVLYRSTYCTVRGWNHGWFQHPQDLGPRKKKRGLDFR
jgi:hypothetical protein